MLRCNNATFDRYTRFLQCYRRKRTALYAIIGVRRSRCTHYEALTSSGDSKLLSNPQAPHRSSNSSDKISTLIYRLGRLTAHRIREEPQTRQIVFCVQL